MRIQDIRTYVLQAPLSEQNAFAYSQAWYHSRMAMLVEVMIDEGLSGFGEAYGPAAATRGTRTSRMTTA